MLVGMVIRRGGGGEGERGCGVFSAVLTSSCDL